MVKTGIKPGTRLELQLDRKMETDPHFVLMSSFETDISDDLLLVASPFFKGHYYPIIKGEIIHITYFTEMGRFHFQGVYLEHRRQGNLHFMLIHRTSEITRIQRRDDFRLPVTLNGTVDFTVLEDDVTVCKREKILTVDISAGGTASQINTRLEQGQEVLLRLPLGVDGDVIPFHASVCWIRDNPPGQAYRYCAGIRFLYEDPNMKERVVQHIFKLQQQRRRRQAGLD